MTEYRRNSLYQVNWNISPFRVVVRALLTKGDKCKIDKSDSTRILLPNSRCFNHEGRSLRGLSKHIQTEALSINSRDTIFG